MKLLYFHLRNSRWFVLMALAAGIISGACSTALIALLNKGLTTEGPARSRFVLGFLILCVMVPVTRYLSATLLVSLGQRIMFTLRMQLCRQIMNAPLPQLEEIGPARLFSSFNNDIMAITNIIVNFPVLFMNLAIVIGCLAYLAWLSWVVLVSVLILVTVGVAVYQLPMRPAERTLKRAREEQDELFKHFRALTEGTKELKLHHRRGQAFLNEGLQSAALAYRRHIVSGMRIFNAATSISQSLFFILVGLLVFALPSFRTIDNGVLTASVLTIMYMIGPIEQIMGMIPGVGQAKISMRKIEEMGLSLKTNALRDNEKVSWEPNPNWRQFSLSGVTRSYQHESEDHLFTLGPVDLSIYPGELVFLVGGNGSGKTTLAKLLIGLYSPERGQIYFDGELITDENRERFCQQFSVVFYDFFLFEKFLGLDADGSDARARKYLSQLQLERKVQILDGGLSTTNLSQGQRKRLALLTAYLEDRPIYLFDEWAADQDPVFKDVFYNQLLPELKARGKTVIVISHDDRYYGIADRIIKLDSGKVVYDSLVAADAWSSADVAGFVQQVS